MKSITEMIVDLDSLFDKHSRRVENQEVIEELKTVLAKYRDRRSILQKYIDELNKIIAAFPSTMTEEEYYSILITKAAEDDSLLGKIRRINFKIYQYLKDDTEPVWSQWPHDSIAAICGSDLIGPFVSRKEYFEYTKTLSRGYLGVVSWKIGGPPPKPLYL